MTAICEAVSFRTRGLSAYARRGVARQIIGLMTMDGSTATKYDRVEEVWLAEQLQKAVEQSQIGKPLSITVQRGGQAQQLSVRPQELQTAAN